MVKNMTQNRLLPGLLEIQAKAEQKFNNSSWPSTKEEEWRRTDLKRSELKHTQKENKLLL